MDATLISSLVTALLGGGAVATFTAIFKGVKALRDGRRAREQETLNDLKHWMEVWETKYRETEKDLDYYRMVCGKYQYQLLKAGLVPDPSIPEPPSERERS